MITAAQFSQKLDFLYSVVYKQVAHVNNLYDLCDENVFREKNLRKL